MHKLVEVLLLVLFIDCLTQILYSLTLELLEALFRNPSSNSFLELVTHQRQSNHAVEHLNVYLVLLHLLRHSLSNLISDVNFFEQWFNNLLVLLLQLCLSFL